MGTSCSSARKPSLSGGGVVSITIKLFSIIRNNLGAYHSPVGMPNCPHGQLSSTDYSEDRLTLFLAFSPLLVARWLCAVQKALPRSHSVSSNDLRPYSSLNASPLGQSISRRVLNILPASGKTAVWNATKRRSREFAENHKKEPSDLCRHPHLRLSASGQHLMPRSPPIAPGRKVLRRLQPLLRPQLISP